jgi:hypothetical protein
MPAPRTPQDRKPAARKPAAKTAARKPAPKRPATRKVADALDAEIAELEPDTTPGFDMFGATWEVHRKPPSLMVARLGRVDENDPSAIGVLDQLIEHALGAEQHKAFLAAYYAACPDDGDDSELLQEAMQHIFAATVGRPTT